MTENVTEKKKRGPITPETRLARALKALKALTGEEREELERRREYTLDDDGEKRIERAQSALNACDPESAQMALLAVRAKKTT